MDNRPVALLSALVFSLLIVLAPASKAAVLQYNFNGVIDVTGVGSSGPSAKYGPYTFGAGDGFSGSMAFDNDPAAAVEIVTTTVGGITGTGYRFNGPSYHFSIAAGGWSYNFNNVIVAVGNDQFLVNDVLGISGNFDIISITGVSDDYDANTLTGLHAQVVLISTSDTLPDDSLPLALPSYISSLMTITEESSGVVEFFAVSAAVNLAAVPEPSAWLLMIAGLSGLFLVRRKTA